VNARFERGELVDVVIKGARVDSVEADTDSLTVYYRPGHSETTFDTVTLMLGGVVEVTRVAPKEWPPRPGDVWQGADGKDWFACGGTSGSDVWLVPAQAGRGAVAEGVVLADHGPLTLTHRRGWTPKTPAGRDTESSPEGSAVATTGQPVDHRAETIAGLRELADWLEANPDVPVAKDSAELSIYAWQALLDRAYTGSDDEQAKVLHRVGALIGADVVEGQHGGPHGRVIKKFLGGVKYELLHVWQTAATPADTNIAQAGEVAGSASQLEPATAVEPAPDGSGDGPAVAPDDDGPVDGCDCEDCDDLRTAPADGSLPRLIEPAPITDPALVGRPSDYPEEG
jgi:hypothetical protein